jgi:hypothetical protein
VLDNFTSFWMVWQEELELEDLQQDDFQFSRQATHIRSWSACPRHTPHALHITETEMRQQTVDCSLEMTRLFMPSLLIGRA